MYKKYYLFVVIFLRNVFVDGKYKYILLVIFFKGLLIFFRNLFYD